jgi:hypothetical protein
MRERDEQSTRSVARRRWLGVAIGALVVLLLAEGAVRVIEPRLPEPPDWFSPSAARLVREMDRAEARGVTGGLTVAGSSMAGRGLIPDVLAEGVPDGRPPHSAALSGGGQTTLQARWLLEEVVPRTHPDSVVWGISSLDFNAARRADTIGRYDGARATRRGFFGGADRTLAKVSALARDRAALRDPYLMSQVLTGTDESDALPLRAPPNAITFSLGYKRLPPAKLARMRREEAAFAKNVQLRDFRIGRAEVDAFRRTLRGLRRASVRPAVVLMPVTQQYIDAHPHGERDFDHWVRVVTRVARQEHVLLVDESRAMPVSAFRDLEHLDLPAAKEFSARVNADLVRAGW